MASSRDAPLPTDSFDVARILDSRAAQFGDRVVMNIDGQPITFVQMRDRVNAAANVLLDQGISKGDSIALFGGSTPQWVYFWLAAGRIGVVVAAVNAANKGDYLRHALQLSGAKLVVTDTGERCRRVQEIAAEVDSLRVVLVHESAMTSSSSPGRGVELHALSELLDSAPVSAPPVKPGDPLADTAALFFTSGTTGPSKAVAISWHYLFTVAATMASAWEFDIGEVIWTAMPLFHVSAGATILAPLLVGGTTVLAPAFHPTEVWDQVRAFNAVGFVGAGAMVSMLWTLPASPADGELPLRFISAAPIPAEIYRGLERRFGCRIVTVYGLTEAFPLAVKAVSDEGVPGTSGRINDNFEVALLDADGKPVADGVGEIACRPKMPAVMSHGYVDAKSSVTRRVRRHDAWFRTGDLGRIDQDGNLSYVDRVKDSIRRRGENISSVEVETVVAGHPAVNEAAAVGVPSDLGEEDILVVVTVCGGDLEPTALLDFCAERMPYFCVPRYVRVVDELPKNTIGRIRKNLLRETGVDEDTWDRERAGYTVRR